MLKLVFEFCAVLKGIYRYWTYFHIYFSGGLKQMEGSAASQCFLVFESGVWFLGPCPFSFLGVAGFWGFLPFAERIYVYMSVVGFESKRFR